MTCKDRIKKILYGKVLDIPVKIKLSFVRHDQDIMCTFGCILVYHVPNVYFFTLLKWKRQEERIRKGDHQRQ